MRFMVLADAYIALALCRPDHLIEPAMTRSEPQLFLGAALCLAAPLCLLPLPAWAQTSGEPRIDAGQTAETTAGQVGERQEADESPINVQPAQRIENRIESRVRSRVNKRVDNRPDTEPDAGSSYEIADIRARQASGLRQRSRKR